MGGGNRPWGDNNPCCVNLLINDKVERTMTGSNTESMTT